VSKKNGPIEECTLSEVLDFGGPAAQGDILYRGASTWTRLAAGTRGRYLQTAGARKDAVFRVVDGLYDYRSIADSEIVEWLNLGNVPDPPDPPPPPDDRPTLEERIVAAETLINLILDEEDV